MESCIHTVEIIRTFSDKLPTCIQMDITFRRNSEKAAEHGFSGHVLTSVGFQNVFRLKVLHGNCHTRYVLH